MYYQLFNDTEYYIFSNINHIDTLNNKHDIEILYCINNQLTELPELPVNLKELYCTDNQLIQLPQLPDSLIDLDCSHNQLTQLQQLPNSLTHLNCNNNKLTQLPKLPSNLKFIQCYNNSKNLHKYIIHCKSLYYYKKYDKYRYIDTLTDLLNYKIENYYYFRIIKYYDKILKLYIK